MDIRLYYLLRHVINFCIGISTMKRLPFPFFTVQSDFSLKHRHDIMNDGRVQVETVLCGGILKAFNASEHIVAFFLFGHARTGVLDGQCQHSVGIVASR